MLNNFQMVNFIAIYVKSIFTLNLYKSSFIIKF